MPRVSAAFFTAAIACLLLGMSWGMYMAGSEDMVTAPAHAHLNLLGWVTMAIYGTFYALTAPTLRPKLAWTHFIVSFAGLAVMIAALGLYLAHGNDPKFGPFIGIGGLLSLLGLLLFGVSVIRELIRPRP